MPTYTVGGITWNYTLSGTAPNQTAGIGVNETFDGTATSSGTSLSGAIIIPATLGTENYPVTIINTGAFRRCPNITSVTIPNSVITLNGASFWSCGLTSVTIGNSVTTISNYTFYDCTNLTSVTIPNSVTFIGSYAFYNGTSLTSINIPDSVTSIGDNAFLSTSTNLVVTMNTGKFGITVPSTNKTFFGGTSVDFVLPPPPPPTMTITSSTSGVTNGSTTNNASISLTFTSSASTTDFAVNDISVTNGALSAFAGVGTDGTVYTATFAPTNQGLCTISVPADTFTDAGSQNNTAATTFNWTFDNVSPSMTITSSTVTSGSITNNASISLTFTSTEATTDFDVGDISVSNGALSDFAGVGTDGMVYTATFTPTGPGPCTIDVDADVYTDAATNLNNLASTFNWTFARQVSFDANTLTITNSIDANAADLVFFVLPAGEEMSNLNVTAFTGTGTITYDLSTDGGTSVSSGTFTGTGTNLLGANLLSASTNTTYVLTLTSNAAITYTIVGTKVADYINVPLPVSSIYYTFDVDGTNSGSLGSSANITLGTTTIDTSIKYAGTGSLSSPEYTPSGAGVPQIDYNTGTTGTTISFWARIKSTGSGNRFLYASLPSPPTTTSISSVPNMNALLLTSSTRFIYYGSGPGNQIIDSPYSLYDDQWHHYAITCSGGTGTSRTISLYLDNTLLSSTLSTTGLADNTNHRIWLGGVQYGNSPTGPDRGLFGNIDDFRIYDSILDAAAINTIYVGPQSTPVSFVGNTLTIQNSIDSTDVDSLSFVFPAGEEMSNLNVTAFTGTGTGTDTITYDLSTTGGASISSGTFTGTGTNLLGANVLTASTNTTYVLTLTSNAAITYTIVGTKVADYANVTPSPVSFVGNTLTVQNSLNATDVDKVSFDVTAGSLFYSLKVTSLLNSNSISYALDISGGSTISSGSFTQSGADLLNGERFEQSTNTTYILTLTSGGINTYSIVGQRLASGYTGADMLSIGLVPNFGMDAFANRLNPAYMEDYLDVSGGNVIVRGDLIMGNGTAQIHSITFDEPYTFNADISLDNRFFVGGDVSMGDASLNIAGDISINGFLSVGSYLPGSISNAAIAVSAGSGNGGETGYVNDVSLTRIIADISYNEKIQMAADVSTNIFAFDAFDNGNTLFRSIDRTDNLLVGGGAMTYQDWTDINMSDTGEYLIGIPSSSTGNVWISADYGNTWRELNGASGDYAQVSGSTRTWISAKISANGSIMMVRGFGTNIFKSTDFGKTWTEKPFNGITFLEFRLVDPRIPFVMSRDGTYIYSYSKRNSNNQYETNNPQMQLIYSHDGGDNWTMNDAIMRIDDGLSTSSSGQYVFINHNAGGGPFISAPVDVLRYSDDYGVTYTLLPNRVATPIRSVVTDEGLLYLVDRGNMFKCNLASGTISEYPDNTFYLKQNDATVPVIVQLPGAAAPFTTAFQTSADGKYIMWFGNDGIGGIRQIRFVVSNNYGETFQIINVSPFSGFINTTENLVRGGLFTNMETGNYVVAARSRDGVYRRKYQGDNQANPISSVFFDPTTTLKLTNSSVDAIQLGNGSKITSSNIASGSFKDGNVVFNDSSFNNITVDGAFTSSQLNDTSDYRIKTNIQDLDETHTIDSLHPVSYYQTQLAKPQIGFLAHELQEYYPELVDGEKDGDQMQSVNYNGLLPILIKEIQQLKTRIANIRARKLVQ